MSLPRWLALLNLHITNPILGLLASWAPGMGVVIQVGRKTHHHYRPPVVLFRRDRRFLIALTYGRDSQWVQDVVIANGCELENRKQKLRLIDPCIIHDELCRDMLACVRPALGILDVPDFLELTVAPD
jgi:hypothetical protein